MTKLYILGNNSSAPSPWSMETSFSNKYIRMCGNYSETRTTGGSATHTHTLASSSEGSSGSLGTGSSWPGQTGWVIEHSGHTISASFSSNSNNPLYYDLALWYMDLSIWETAERRFPANAILLSETALSDSELSRFTSADGRLIRIGTPGNIGGDSDGIHDHTFSGNLSSYYASYEGVYGGGGGYWSRDSGHGHTFSGTSSSGTLLPVRVQTRLYLASTQTIKALQGVICFVDGAFDTGKWTFVSWAGKCIESVNSDASSTGSDTHNHSISATSSSWTSSTQLGIVWNTAGYNRCPGTHSHTVSGTASTESHVPPYVNLYPVKLNATLYHVTAGTQVFGLL